MSCPARFKAWAMRCARVGHHQRRLPPTMVVEPGGSIHRENSEYVAPRHSLTVTSTGVDIFRSRCDRLRRRTRHQQNRTLRFKASYAPPRLFQGRARPLLGSRNDLQRGDHSLTLETPP